jgi:hypothetical protein
LRQGNPAASAEAVEQRLGLFEIGGVEPFGKSAEDRGEQCARLLLPALLSSESAFPSMMPPCAPCAEVMRILWLDKVDQWTQDNDQQ